MFSYHPLSVGVRSTRTDGEEDGRTGAEDFTTREEDGRTREEGEDDKTQTKSGLITIKYLSTQNTNTIFALTAQLA